MGILTFNVNSDDRFNLSSTSKGNQIKWVKDGKFLKADSMGYESIAEVLAAEVEAATENLDYINYSLCLINENGTNLFGCVSDVFTDTGDSIISVDRLLSRYAGSEAEKHRLLKNISGKDLVKKVVGICSQLTSISYDEVMVYFSNIIKLDAIILNEDRHTNNITFIKSGEGVYKCSPIFDNGLSFLSDAVDYPLEYNTASLIRKVKSKPFSVDFMKQLEYFSDCDPLKIDIESLDYRLSKYTVEFKEKEFNRAKAVLKNRLKLLKGVAWK